MTPLTLTMQAFGPFAGSETIDFTALGESSLKASQFFSQLLADTKNGYLADPKYGGNKDMKAWVAIGFPGARAQYTEWVDQHDVKDHS